jgi:hypothetical protein
MKRLRIVVQTSVSVVSVVAVATGQVCRFDVGPEDSPVCPGLTLVTAKMDYAPQRGFG